MTSRNSTEYPPTSKADVRGTRKNRETGTKQRKGDSSRKFSQEKKDDWKRKVREGLNFQEDKEEKILPSGNEDPAHLSQNTDQDQKIVPISELFPASLPLENLPGGESTMRELSPSESVNPSDRNNYSQQEPDSTHEQKEMSRAQGSPRLSNKRIEDEIDAGAHVVGAKPGELGETREEMRRNKLRTERKSSENSRRSSQNLNTAREAPFIFPHSLSDTPPPSPRNDADVVSVNDTSRISLEENQKKEEAPQEVVLEAEYIPRETTGGSQRRQESAQGRIFDGELLRDEKSSSASVKNDPSRSEAVVENAPETVAHMSDDGIVEGFGRVDEREEAPEILPDFEVGEKGISQESKEMMSFRGEGAMQRSGEEQETIEEIRARVAMCKQAADQARDTYLTARYRIESRWRALKQYFARLRSSPAPAHLSNEIESLKIDWQHKLTEYQEARVLLAKEEAKKGGVNRPTGEIMAETLRELDLRMAVENYNAYKDAAWGERKDSAFLRALGRAKNWAESYRALDWKKRLAISGALFGVGAAGIVLGSTGLVAVGFGGKFALRLLGSYGAGRGLYEFLEGRKNREMGRYHEAALSYVETKEDFSVLEARIKNYADRVQKNLDVDIKANRRRIAAGGAAGMLLFAGGTAFTYRDAIHDVGAKVAAGFTQSLVQLKILLGFENFENAPLSLAGTVSEVPQPPLAESESFASRELSPPPENSREMLAAAKELSAAQQGPPVHHLESTASYSGEESISQEVVPETQVPSAPLPEEGAEIHQAGQPIREFTLQKGSSIEGVLKGLGTDGDIHRAYLRFLEELKAQGETNLEKWKGIFEGRMHPGDIVRTEVSPNGQFRIVAIERHEGGALVWRKVVSGFEGAMEQVSASNENLASSEPGLLEKGDSPVPSTLEAASEIQPVNIPQVSSLQTEPLPATPEAVMRAALPPDLGIPEESQRVLDTFLPSSNETLPVLENESSPSVGKEGAAFSVPENAYLQGMRQLLDARLGDFPLSENQRMLIENIFSARIPLAESEPSESVISSVEAQLCRLLLPLADLGTVLSRDVHEVQNLVSREAYSALVRIAGDPLRISHVMSTGEKPTVEKWLSGMARYIVTHRFVEVPEPSSLVS